MIFNSVPLPADWINVIFAVFIHIGYVSNMLLINFSMLSRTFIHERFIVLIILEISFQLYNEIYDYINDVIISLSLENQVLANRE